MTRTNKAQASRMGMSTQQATPEAIDNQHIFEDGGEEPNAYDKFYNSKVGAALQWVPYVGTALDIGNAINHPSGENAGWAAASLASDLFGGRIATKAAKTAAKKVIAEGVKNGGYVLRRTPRGTRLKIKTKDAAKDAYVTTKIGHTGLMNSDNYAQYLANAWGSYLRPTHLPEVTVTSNYPHELRVWNTVNLARYGFNEPEFLRRLDYNDRRYIKTPYGGESTHLMANDGNYAYPMILDINGTLHNYDKKYGDYWNRDPKENGDYIKFLTPGDARYFAEHYKKNWPIFFQGAFKDGKDILPGFKGGFDSFANGVGRAIYNEMVANGWYTPARYDNIMSLLSSESGHGTSMLATKYHNYGGRKNAKGGYMHFKDDSAFAKDHLAYLQRMHRAAWNAKDTMDYVKALKASNYMGDDIYHYYKLLKGQLSARKAWNAAMKTWGLPKLVIKTAITEPVDATRAAKPVMEIPVLIEQPRQLQPTTYIDPTLLFDQPEELLQPVVEDNYEASLLPSIQDAMLYFLPSLTPFANNDFMSQLVLIGLPGAKYGKDSGIHIKPSHRGRFTRYLKSHPGMTAEKAKHSKSAAVRKMATFAINARKWRH